MKIYTKKGDEGSTGLFGGRRVPKDDVRVECIGSLDEANSTLGLLRVKLDPVHAWQEGLHRIQKEMMDTMSHLARPSDIKKENNNPLPLEGALFCENWIDQLEGSLSSPSDYFILPGGNEISAICHVVRTQFRRAERRLVALMREDLVHPCIPAYVNRLSDLFFTMARVEMDQAGLSEERWKLFLYKRIKSDY